MVVGVVVVFLDCFPICKLDTVTCTPTGSIMSAMSVPALIIPVIGHTDNRLLCFAIAFFDLFAAQLRFMVSIFFRTNRRDPCRQDTVSNCLLSCGLCLCPRSWPANSINTTTLQHLVCEINLSIFFSSSSRCVQPSHIRILFQL